MKLLFIKLKHIGDALLLTPMLRAVRQAYPEAVIWVVVRRGCEGILAGCPDIDRVLTAAAPEKQRRRPWNWATDFALTMSIRRQGFDYAFELGDGDRGRWLTLLSGAPRRCTNAAGKPLHWWWRQGFTDFSHHFWYTSHQAAKDFFTVSDMLPRLLPLPIPRLCFAREHVQDWPAAAGLGSFALVHPATRWSIKRWPEDRWAELCAALLHRFPAIVLSCGPAWEEIQLNERLRQVDPHRILSTGGATSWAQLAGLLYRADLFVGVDTAAMHLAAACACPTVALFMGSSPIEWAPWRTRHVIVQPAPENQDTALSPALRISLGQVVQACDDLLQETSAP
jgi:heptosyltransferase III